MISSLLRFLYLIVPIISYAFFSQVPVLPESLALCFTDTYMAGGLQALEIALLRLQPSSRGWDVTWCELFAQNELGVYVTSLGMEW